MSAAGMSPQAPVCYYFDEHVLGAIVPYLRRYSIDVLTAYEAGRANQQIPDAEQLTYATEQGRVLVSRDKHFLNPHVVPQIATRQHAGIVCLRRDASIGDQARYLRYLAETATMESLAGQISYYQPIPRGLFDDD